MLFVERLKYITINHILLLVRQTIKRKYPRDDWKRSFFSLVAVFSHNILYCQINMIKNNDYNPE